MWWTVYQTVSLRGAFLAATNLQTIASWKQLFRRQNTDFYQHEIKEIVLRYDRFISCGRDNVEKSRTGVQLNILLEIGLRYVCVWSYFLTDTAIYQINDKCQRTQNLVGWQLCDKYYCAVKHGHVLTVRQNCGRSSVHIKKAIKNDNSMWRPKKEMKQRLI